MAAQRCCSDARAAQLAALLGLVEGFVWALLSLLALLASVCVLPAKPDTLLYLLYFYSTECADPPEFLQRLQPGWPLPASALGPTLRTRGLAAARLALAALRLFTSAALLGAVRRQQAARRSVSAPAPPCVPVYFCWLLVSMLDLVLDVLTLVFYGLDFINTAAHSPRGVMRLLEVDTVGLSPGWEQLLPSWGDSRSARAGPTALLFVLASRGAPFLFVVDIVAAVFVTRAARRFQTRSRTFWTLKRARDEVAVRREAAAAAAAQPGNATQAETGTVETDGSDGEMTLATRATGTPFKDDEGVRLRPISNGASAGANPDTPPPSPTRSSQARNSQRSVLTTEL